MAPSPGIRLGANFRKVGLWPLAAKIWALLNNAFCLLLLLNVLRYTTHITKYGLSITGGAAALLPWLIGFFSLGGLAMAVILWKNKTWSLAERLYYSFLMLTAVFGVFLVVNLVTVVNW